jgi:hypothetical protein
MATWWYPISPGLRRQQSSVSALIFLFARQILLPLSSFWSADFSPALIFRFQSPGLRFSSCLVLIWFPALDFSICESWAPTCFGSRFRFPCSASICSRCFSCLLFSLGVRTRSRRSQVQRKEPSAQFIFLSFSCSALVFQPAFGSLRQGLDPAWTLH